MALSLRRIYPTGHLDFEQLCRAVDMFKTQVTILRRETISLLYPTDHAASDITQAIRRDYIQRAIQQRSQLPVRKFVFDLEVGEGYEGNPKPSARFEQIYEPHDEEEFGLTLTAKGITRKNLFDFEQQFLAEFDVPPPRSGSVELGRPAEVVCVVVDMRGYTTFCEQPHIESPYIAMLAGAFYNFATARINKLPPDVIKLLGDGIMFAWEVTHGDRQLTIDVALESLKTFIRDYASFKDQNDFPFTPPAEVSGALTYGTAAALSGDFVGRPLNLAARLCGVAPGQSLLVDADVPGVSDAGLKREEYDLKSFGLQPALRWAVDLA